MANKQKILFIINPISGGHNKTAVIRDIPKLLDAERFDLSVSHTKRCGHAAQLAKKAVEKNMDIVVAVGGDGTINEIASQLVNTNTALAIVPCGSGNGLARDLKIPLHYKKAIQLVNQLHLKKIDVGICNQNHFFSLAGIGFDAKVAYDFNRGKKRRFLGYAWAILKAYFTIHDQSFEVTLDQEKIEDKYFFITVANCTQWGYGVKVAPNAKLDDSLLSVNLCKKPSFFALTPFVIKLLLGKINISKYCTLRTAKEISVTSQKKFFYHIDGDAKGITRSIRIEILPAVLSLVTNRDK